MLIIPLWSFCYVVKNNEVLLIKRNMPPDKNKYTVIGGKKEREEDLVTACKREVYEETGLILGSVRFRGVINEKTRLYVTERISQIIESREIREIRKGSLANCLQKS